MFDLEKSIASWRQRMASGGVNNNETLAELESHLREDVEAQMNSGAAAADAFNAAAARLGAAKPLQTEFARALGAKEALRRRLRAAMIWVSASGLPVTLIALVAAHHSAWNAAQWVAGSGAEMVSALCFVAGLVIHRCLPSKPGWRGRFAVVLGLAAGVLIWAIVFTRVVLPDFVRTPSDLTLAVLWAFAPLSVFSGFLLELARVEQAQRGHGIS